MQDIAQNVKQSRRNCTDGKGHRAPQDLPCIGQAVRLELTVRRFGCINKQCEQKTFVERFPDWLPVYARRTTRLTAVVRQIGFEVGGESGARILEYLHIAASGDTILRVVRRTTLSASDEPRGIGVDDWAFKKGNRYGTIIVDLEAHRVLDILPDRTTETLAEWLQLHPGIKVVARDRAAEYANGIQVGAPQAVQVADRWHLLLNGRQMAERFLGTIHQQLQTLPMLTECAETLKQRRTAFPRSRAEQARSQASRNQRIAQYEQVQQWRQEGYNILQIAQMLGGRWETARNYFYATSFPERNQRPPVSSILDPYLSYLEQRHAEGCENATQLGREIQASGYPGSPKQVRRWMQLRRTQPAPTTPNRYRDPQAHPITRPKSVLPSAKQLAWLLVVDPETLTDDERLILAHICQDSSAAEMYSLVQQFVTMIKLRQVDQLTPWLTACASSSVRQIQTFAIGIQPDYAAIYAALETSWSNGQTEGQVNRLKFIKRQMYGRAHFDLLRLRVLCPP
jgi:transposase